MKRLLILLLAVLVCSCEKEIRFNGKYDGEKLVLFSCANPDTVLCATIYKSVFFLSKEYRYDTTPLSGATVTAEVNGKETYTFRQEGTGDSLKYVSEYIPRPGDHILVRAEHNDFKSVYGETDVPQYPEFRLESYSFKTAEVTQRFNEVHMNVTITDPGQEENYYRMTAAQKYMMVYSDGEDPDWLWKPIYSDDVIFFSKEIGDISDAFNSSEESIPEFFDDGAFNGQSHRFPIWLRMDLMMYETDSAGRITYYDSQNMEDLDMRDFMLRVENVSESLYRYGKSLRAAEQGGDLLDIFGEPVSIYNNIVDGIGCVGAVCGRDVTLDQVPRQ